MDPMDDDVVELPNMEPPKLRYGEIDAGSGADMLAAGIAAGNISRQADDAEVMALPEVSPALIAL